MAKRREFRVGSCLRDVNLSRLIGTEFYIGYGRDGDEMLRAGRYRKIYSVAKIQ